MVFLCNSCLQAVEVVMDGPGSVLIGDSDRYSCPWCSAGNLVHHKVLGQAVREKPGKYRLKVMVAEDFYRAARGMGLPGEYGATPGLVLEHFRFGRVTRMDVEGVGDPLKTVVHSVTMDSPAGVFKLYFGSSTQGAVIYRIEDVSDERRGLPASRAQDRPGAVPHSDEGSAAPADEGPDGLPSV